MAKRVNPYLEDFIPQSKFFVGIKQFNQKENRMNEIYEKTLQILYKGARKQLDHPEIPANEDKIQLNNKDKLKQLFLTNDGSLQHNATMITNRPEKVLCCQGEEMQTRCGYCEKAICSTCKQSCTECYGSYCSSCCVKKFENDESATCISCYK